MSFQIIDDLITVRQQQLEDPEGGQSSLLPAPPRLLCASSCSSAAQGVTELRQVVVQEREELHGSRTPPVLLGEVVPEAVHHRLLPSQPLGGRGRHDGHRKLSHRK
ncbi:hypothetical protein CRUP_012754 [Coryphaenoides rupestris]|nr:hypothetical protein CRUP_012754 [Coryphaenoides rupestris]